MTYNVFGGTLSLNQSINRAFVAGLSADCGLSHQPLSPQSPRMKRKVCMQNPLVLLHRDEKLSIL